MQLEIIRTFVLAAFLAFCRIGACFMVMPGLGSARVPVQVRLFVAVAVSLALLTVLWPVIVPHLSASPDALFLLIVSELLTGAVIGFLVRFYVLALQFIGSAATMMVGLGGMAGMAIEENEPEPALSALISLSALALLFALDFHYDVIRALIASYDTLPIEAFFKPQGALVDLADTLGDSFLVVVRLGSPFLAYAILVNLATGFINKLTPQIPVYFISLPFVIAGGMILMYFAIDTMLALFAGGFTAITLGR
jgi:flagellar biosynthetic protein FliR